MYEYSDSIECKLCGRRVILTDVELENHFNHCPGMADCGCHYLQPENPKVPIRQYSERHSTGVVLAAIEDSSLLPVGCIIIADGKTTMGELACSEAVRQLIKASGSKLTEAEPEYSFMSVDFDVAADEVEQVFECSILEEFRKVRMLRASISLNNYRCSVTFKKVVTFEKSSTESFAPINVGQGLVPTNDFYCLGYNVDRLCDDSISQKNSALLSYVNKIVRHVEPAMYLAMESYSEDSELDSSLYGNYISPALTEEFYTLIDRNENCLNVSVEQIYSQWSGCRLKKIVGKYRSTRGMSKQDKVDYLTSGQHIEVALREKINGYEYGCLHKLMAMGGHEYIYDELDISYMHLYELGLLLCGSDSEGNKVVYIPREFMFIFKRLIYDKEMVDKVRRMRQLDMRLNGLLYVYGVLPINKLYSLYCDVFDMAFNPFDKYDDEHKFIEYVVGMYVAWSNRDSAGDMYLGDGIYIFHDRLEYPGEIEYYKVPEQMRSPNPAEIEAAGDRDYVEYNDCFDRICIDLLNRIDNRDEASNLMMNYYMYNLLVFESKQGFSPDEIFDNLTRNLPLPGEELLHIYEQIRSETQCIMRWDLGGYSALDLKERDRGSHKIQKLTMR